VSNRVQTLRSSVPGALPQTGTRQPGELWLNFSDNALGFIDSTQTALKLLGVRLFVPTANYAIGDFVVYAANLYRAIAPSAPSAFVAANWSKVGTAQDLAAYLPLAGGTLTGPLTLPAAAPTTPAQAANKSYVDAGDAAATAVANSKLPLGGGTLTGPLTLSGPPAQPLQAATKAYVDSGAFLPIIGGTLTGPLHGTDISASGGLDITGSAFVRGAGGLICTNGQLQIQKGNAVNPVLWMYDGSTNRVGFYFDIAGGHSVWSDQYSGANIQMGPAQLISLNAANVNHSSNVGVSGNLTVSGSATVSGAATIAGGLGLAGNNMTITAAAGSTAGWALYNSGSAILSQFYANSANNQCIWVNNPYGSSITLAADVMAAPAGGHNFIVTPGIGYQAGGGQWGAYSDARIKTVQSEYSAGLDEVLRLRPVVYTYKGNDTSTADVSTPPARPPDDPTPLIEVVEAPYPASMHYHVALEQKSFVGLVAQELEQIFPSMVSESEGYIDGVRVTDLRNVNASELIYALVNAVKTLTARVQELEALVVP
jgi:hypothetical protein